MRGRVEFLMSQEDLALLKTFQVLRNTFSCKQCHWQYCRNNIVTFDLERGVKGMNAINISLENKSTSEDLAQSKPV